MEENEILDKEKTKKILYILFSDDNGKSLIESYKRDEILKKLKDDDIKNLNFWFEILDIMSKIQKYNLGEELIQNLKSEFQKEIKNGINKLLELRFDTFFKEGDEETINNYEDLIKKEFNDNIKVKKDDKIKIFSYEQESREEFIKPYKSGKIFSFPLILIEINKNQKKLKISSSSKRGAGKKFKSYLKTKYEDLFPKSEEILKFEKFNLTLPEFLRFLQNNDKFVLNKIHLHHPNIDLLIKTKQDIEFLQGIINQFDEPADFLNLRELGIIYLHTFKDKSEEIPFKLSVEIEKTKERYFQVKLFIDKKYSEYKEMISKELSKKTEIDKKYLAPSSYYFNRAVLQKKEEFISEYLEKFQETCKSDKIINVMEKKHILKEDEEKKLKILDKEKLFSLIKECLVKSKNKIIDAEGKTKFQITSVKKERNKFIINLIVKEHQEEQGKHYDRRYKIKFSLGKVRLRKYDKAYSIIISHANFFKIIENAVNGNYEKNVKYVYELLKREIKYFQIVLYSLAINAYDSLNDAIKEFINSKNVDERKKIGTQIEYYCNILLRYLFSNYLPYSGKDKPDGILWLSGSEDIFVIDTKIHEKLKVPEFRKMKDYLDNFYDEIDIEPPKLRKGIFIVSGKVTKSLNPKERDKQFKDASKYSISFITVEFIQKLFELYNQHGHMFRDRKEIQNIFLEAFLRFLKESKSITEVKELSKIQKDIITGLRSKINDILNEYVPQKKEEGV